MRSSGLKTINFQIMTKDNKQQKLSDSTEPAIAYSTCYVQVFSRLFLGDCLIESDKIESGSVDLILFAQEPFTRELINKAIPNLPFNSALFSVLCLPYSLPFIMVL